jgi:hypothetical protein
MGLYSSVNREIYGYVARVRGGGGGCPQYIPQLRVTEEYIPVYSSVRCNRGIYFIFLGTDEYSGIYSSALYSLVPSSINQGI